MTCLTVYCCDWVLGGELESSIPGYGFPKANIGYEGFAFQSKLLLISA